MSVKQIAIVVAFLQVALAGNGKKEHSPYSEPDYEKYSGMEESKVKKAPLEIQTPQFKKGIGGYHCLSWPCAAEGRPGIKWDFVCQIGNRKFYCVPFIIDDTFEPGDLKQIYKAMRWMRDNTCVAFVYRQNESDYVHITKGNSGCASECIGKCGGNQTVSLSQGCFEYPTIDLHELMHAIGFEHLHQRHDRDDYITINLKNINPDLESMFIKKPNAGATDNMTFNYDSIMLYGSQDFQKSNKAECEDKQCFTMKRKDGGQLVRVWEKPKVPQSDYDAINFLYGCNDPQFADPKKKKKA
ncbi:Zinc metalloproteinase nas-6 [Halotydeus destructor]|nr:Zinc metalloproteinase nas-6 [Halotydeus destructor]KAI1306280.1 Zinc metalloproteinase nas-6 [Halotydeus destructor]